MCVCVHAKAGEQRSEDNFMEYILSTLGVMSLDSKCFHPPSYCLPLSSSFIITNGAPGSVVMCFIAFVTFCQIVTQEE